MIPVTIALRILLDDKAIKLIYQDYFERTKQEPSKNENLFLRQMINKS